MRFSALILGALTFGGALAATGAIAQSPLDAFRLDLSVSALTGDGVEITGGRGSLDAALAFGRNGLQISGRVEALDFGTVLPGDLEMSALRLILFRDMSERLRLGFSAGVTGGDEPLESELSLGIHAQYDRPGLRIGGDFVKGLDDDATNGALVATLWAEQDLYPDLTLRGEMFRRSTDTEFDDLSAVMLGLEHRFTDDFSGNISWFRSGADDRSFSNDGLRIGASWHLSAASEVYSTVVAKEGSGLDAVGLTIGFRMETGNSARLFDTGPLPDLVDYGTF